MVTFVSCRVDSLVFTRSSVFPREELHRTIELCWGHFRYFQALMYQSDNLRRLLMISPSVVFRPEECVAVKFKSYVFSS